MIQVLLPLRTFSESNTRVHWAVRAKRARIQRNFARLFVGSSLARSGPMHAGAIIITLVRIGPGKLDSDNLAGALKAVRDGVADALGLDDGDPRLEWQYGQEKGPYNVRVEIT
jgi:hypothetical protein